MQSATENIAGSNEHFSRHDELRGIHKQKQNHSLRAHKRAERRGQFPYQSD
jgi:hypothetical protein